MRRSAVIVVLAIIPIASVVLLGSGSSSVGTEQAAPTTIVPVTTSTMPVPTSTIAPTTTTVHVTPTTVHHVTPTTVHHVTPTTVHHVTPTTVHHVTPTTVHTVTPTTLAKTASVTPTTVAKPVHAAPVPYRIGIATWYSYVPGRCATSYLPKGTVIHVRVLHSDREITCLVTDHQQTAPHRVVDLSETQFSELAPLWRGVVEVIVSW